MSIELMIFWLLGIPCIGLGFFILTKSIPPKTTKELETIRIIVGWGVFIEVIWIGIGILALLAILISK